MTISEALMPEFDAEMDSTRKILECVPEDRLSWTPHEKSMTLGRLAGHVAESCAWAVDIMTSETLSPDTSSEPFDPCSRAELLENFDENRVKARQLLADATDEQFGVNWTMYWDGHKIIDGPRLSVVRTWVMNHSIHHRAQLGVYLRLNNIAFPGVYGPSATDMEQMQAASA